MKEAKPPNLISCRKGSFSFREQVQVAAWTGQVQDISTKLCSIWALPGTFLTMGSVLVDGCVSEGNLRIWGIGLTLSDILEQSWSNRNYSFAWFKKARAFFWCTQIIIWVISAVIASGMCQKTQLEGWSPVPDDGSIRALQNLLLTLQKMWMHENNSSRHCLVL